MLEFHDLAHRVHVVGTMESSYLAVVSGELFLDARDGYCYVGYLLFQI